jgi:hypothetical protein
MPLVAGEDVRTPLGAFRVVFGIGHDNQISPTLCICSRPVMAHRDESDSRVTCLKSGDKRTRARCQIDANDPQLPIDSQICCAAQEAQPAGFPIGLPLRWSHIGQPALAGPRATRQRIARNGPAGASLPKRSRGSIARAPWPNRRLPLQCCGPSPGTVQEANRSAPATGRRTGVQDQGGHCRADDLRLSAGRQAAGAGCRSKTAQSQASLPGQGTSGAMTVLPRLSKSRSASCSTDDLR